ncbi:glycosyl hydrolase [Paenibacillus sp. J31TS4]|uniref:glycoside hydrolase family 88 protein n=1 Tax=Paenibacillus sp. J31TS4 TaxID=2807195 RepID=UPI001B1B5036|nr:glycoside hydrolase family 88 protein [Paenibacillus sp. J31TS4]GIP39337.1 glycosyl hydrolase [Paenibacillus sp. J31TS4]
MWTQAIEDAVAKTKANLTKFGDRFPHITQGTAVKQYEWGDNTDWIEGFYAGMVWLSYEYTREPELLEAANRQLADFRRRLDEDVALDHHDIGFLYCPSALAGWIVEGSEDARRLALDAADRLMRRWRPEGQYIQAWGPKGHPENGGRIIIDCLMNLPLLYWASAQTGDPSYAEAARIHADKSRRFLVRGDDSSYHTFYFEPETGSAIRGGTHQGYQDGSTWTRGQAWGIYGFALSYRYTGDAHYLETSRRLARYFVEHLPEDNVAYWDFDVEIGPDTYRDSSASAIAAAGLLELLEHLPEDDADRAYFTEAVERSMRSLVEKYATIGEPDAEGLLKHGSYYIRGNRGPDDYMIWGDYYYLEALMRLERKIPGYWYERR